MGRDQEDLGSYEHWNMQYLNVFGHCKVKIAKDNTI